MSRAKWSTIGLFAVMLLGFIAAGGFYLTTDGGEVARADNHVVKYYSYAVKFVCGYYDPSAFAGDAEASHIYEGPVKPGNYATDINIHNPNYYYGKNVYNTQLPIMKKLVFLWGYGKGRYYNYREPKTSMPTKLYRMKIGPDYATMDDCTAIFNLAKTLRYEWYDSQSHDYFTIGYLVILSPLPLDITAVYTAQVPGRPNSSASGISIDVEQITGRQISVPKAALRY